MNSVKFVIFSSLMMAFTHAQAFVSVLDRTQNPSFTQASEPASIAKKISSHERLYLAGKPKSSTKTTTKTKKDGDIVTKEVTKTNDGQGNKTTTKTTTTTHPSDSSHGGGGASYEGE